MPLFQGIRCLFDSHEWLEWEELPEKCKKRRVCGHCGKIMSMHSHKLDAACKCIRCGSTEHNFVDSNEWLEWEETPGGWDSDFGSYDSVEIVHRRCDRCGTETSDYTGRRQYV